jgi:geranylgeranyl diphosphate synthase, type II
MKNASFDFELALYQINQAILEYSASLISERLPTELYSPVAYFLGLGGKRIRPLLSLLGCYLFEAKYELAIKPSIAVELFHNFTLIHDDIMDNAPLRRGNITVHEKWNTSVAILSGDVTLIEAYDLLENVNSEIRTDVFKLFNKVARQVCEGQQLDMNFEHLIHVKIEQYLEMIALKTAVLLGFSLYMGARIGGATQEQAYSLYQVGLNLGISFQIKDDLLDVFGETTKVGKQTGGDIIANKKTYLLLYALENTSESQKQRFQQHLYSKDISSNDKVRNIVELYNELEVQKNTIIAMKSYFDKAISCLDELDVNHFRKTELKAYFQTLFDRQF